MGFPFKIATIYATFSILWISLSDQLVASLFPDAITQIQTYKGWAFVACSSVLILLLLQHEARRRQHAQAQLDKGSRELHKLSLAVAQSPVSVIITDTQGRIEYVNQAFEKISGYSREEALGENPCIFNSGKTANATYELLWQAINSGQPWEGELMNQRKDRKPYWVQAGISPVTDDSGKITHFLAIEEDISLRKAQEHQIKHQANYDSLTELPNRFLAMDRMSQAINASIRNNQTVVVMFIDLDNFKQVNDSLGHDTGDQLITLAAARIRETVRQTDTVARYGGDEFLVVLSDLESPDDASRVAEKILSMLASPYNINQRQLSITASIGMSLFPDDGQDPYELLRHADAAMFGAKDEGGNRYEYHSASANDAALERMEVEQQLRRALERQELSLHYQPLVDTHTNKIISAEALLRWDNAELGSIPPDQFIPLAEATGLILPIGNWVIETALKQLKQWRDNGLVDLKLSINISPRQFQDPGLIRTIQSTLQELDLPGTLLELEVTENLLVRNQKETQKILNKFQQMGISIALDDFGTGFSSLSYLKNFSFNTLKIDRSFIKELLDQPQDQALVKATLTMAKGLGLNTVGEGVETDEQLAFLRQHGLDVVQGFLFSAPLPPQQFEQLLHDHPA